MGWVVVSVVDWPCHHPLRVDLEVQQARADQQDPGHRHDQQDLEALSHPRRTKTFVLIIFWKLKTVQLKVKGKERKNYLGDIQILCWPLYEREKYLQGLPSLQQDLGDPEGQVFQTGQLDQLDQQHLSHQENPVSARKRERWLVKNTKQKPCFVYSGEKDTHFIVLSACP